MRSCGEDFAGVCPFEWAGGLVVGLDEGEHLLGEIALACEGTALEQAASKDGEEDLDLDVPIDVKFGCDGGVVWREWRRLVRRRSESRPSVGLVGSAG